MQLTEFQKSTDCIFIGLDLACLSNKDNVFRCDSLSLTPVIVMCCISFKVFVANRANY